MASNNHFVPKVQIWSLKIIGVNNLQGRWVSWFLVMWFFGCVFFEKRPSSRPEAKRLRSEDTAAAPPTAAPEVVAVEEESLRRKAAADLYAQAWAW